MDALTYFLLNYGLYSLLLVVPAALLGVWYGWLAWGRHQTGAGELRKRMEDAERVAQEVEVKLSREREQFKLYQEAAEAGGTAPVAPPDLGRELANLRRDNEVLEKKLNEVRKDREEAEKILVGLRGEKAILEKELADKAKGGGKAKSAKVAAVPKSELKKFKAEKRELEKKLAAQERELEKKLTALRRDLEKKRIEQEKSAAKSISGLEAKLGVLESEGQSKAGEVKELQEVKTRLEEEVTKRREESEKIGAEMVALRAERNTVEEKLVRIRKERDEKLEHLGKLQREKEELVDKLAREVEKRSEDQERTAEELDTLRTKRHELEAQLGSLAKHKEQVAKDLENLGKDRSALESKLVEAQSSATVAEAKLKEVSGDKKGLEDDLASTREERDEVKASLEELLAEKGGLEARVKDLEERVTRTGDELNQLSSAKAELEEKMAEAQRAAAMIKVDLDLACEERAEGRKELEERKTAEGKWADELHRLREEKKALNEQMAALAGESQTEVVIGQLKEEKDRLIHSLANQKRERLQVEDAAGVLRRELHGLRRELVEAEKRAQSVSEMEAELRAAEERLARTQRELTRALGAGQRQTREAGKPEDPSAGEEVPKTIASESRKAESVPEEKNQSRSSAAADDLRASLGTAGESGGEAKLRGGDSGKSARSEASGDGIEEHPRFGPIYSGKPAQVDDLTELKGVGSAIRNKLNRSGIYTFRQIGEWDASQRKAISKELHLRDRIERGRWQEQARARHKEKYGEDL